MKAKILLLFFSLAFFQQGFPQVFPETPKVIKTSARIAGMGGAFTAVADDEMAIFYNPAGLRKIKHARWTLFNPTFDFGSGVRDVFDIIDQLDAASTNEEKVKVLENAVPTNALAGLNLMPFYVGPNLAFGLFGQGHTRVEVLNPVDTRLELSGYADIVLVGSHAHQVNDKLSVGVTGKWLQRQLILPVSNKSVAGCKDPVDTRDPLDPSRAVVVIEKTDVFNCSDFQVDDFTETARTTGFGLDVGALFDLSERLTLGASIRDIGDTSLSGDGQKVRIPMTFAFGIAYRFPAFGLLKDPIIAFDIDRIGDPDSSTGRRLHFGAQAILLKKLNLRAGIHQGYGTFGLGIRLGILQLDYAFFTREGGKASGEQADESHVLSLTLRF